MPPLPEIIRKKTLECHNDVKFSSNQPITPSKNSIKIKPKPSQKFSDYMKKEPMKNFKRMPKIVGERKPV